MNNYTPLLEVRNLTKIFCTRGFFSKKESHTAVSDISFTIKKGEIVGLLGPNGAGKSTTLHMLIGALKPTSGSIFYFGNNFEKERSKALESIAFASGSIQLPSTLSVEQNLDIYAQLYGMQQPARKDRITHLLKTFCIDHIRKISTGHLSFGQLSRVMLAKAFLAQPKIVFLDEATAALDPEIAHTVRNFLTQEQELHETSILIASHNMNEVSQMCDRVLFMKDGKIVASNTPETLTKEVANVKVQFQLEDDMYKMNSFLTAQALPYSIHEQTVTIELDEQAIAHLLRQVAQESIIYSRVTIQKPTLEDYFLKITSNKAAIPHPLKRNSV